MKANITDEQRQYNALMRHKQREKDEQAIRSMLGTETGRWFITRLLDATGIHAKSFTGNSETFYREGKRAIGIYVLQQIESLGMDGLRLKQQAEIEYANQQIEWITLINRKKEEE